MESSNKNSNAQDPTSNENYYKIVKPLRTYERDVSESVREKKPSQISINLEEKKRREEKEAEVPVQEKPADSPKTHRFIKGVFVTFFLLFIVVGGIFALPKVWNLYSSRNVPTATVVKTETWVKGDILIKIDITGKSREGIMDSVKGELQKISPKSGDTIIIHPIEITGDEEKGAAGDKFLGLMAKNAPQPLLRALSQKMSFGYQVREERYIPFLVLGISSYENAYSNMLGWENTMNEDLAGFITEEPGITSNNFQDQIINNKDTRVLRKNDGSTALIYSFLSDQTLILTTDRETYRDILAIVNF